MDERGSAYIIPPVDMVRDESWKQLREKVHRVNRRLAAARTGAAFLRLTEDERKAVVGRCDLPRRGTRHHARRTVTGGGPRSRPPRAQQVRQGARPVKAPVSPTAAETRSRGDSIPLETNFRT